MYVAIGDGAADTTADVSDLAPLTALVPLRQHPSSQCLVMCPHSCRLVSSGPTRALIVPAMAVPCVPRTQIA